jgi:ring-1,2-phenylacetyl-CoA epoxidase subunit PaaD
VVSDPSQAAVTATRVRQIWQTLESVMDPEIPVVSVVDLGIVRRVRAGRDGRLRVGITPTYSGCPATEVITQTIRAALDQSGFADVALETLLWPPWSSEWLSEAGRRKLVAYGIAVEREEPGTLACPRCASRRIERVSEFGSTPCKAHYRCRECLEPFDTFKCL